MTNILEAGSALDERDVFGHALGTRFTSTQAHHICLFCEEEEMKNPTLKAFH